MGGQELGVPKEVMAELRALDKGDGGADASVLSKATGRAVKQPSQEAKTEGCSGNRCIVKGSSSGMGMGGKCVLRGARKGKKNKLPEKLKVKNKDWLGKKGSFCTQEFSV